MSKMGANPRRRRTGGFRVFIPGKNGGASRDRTDDLKLAKLALSQLSYGPIGLAFASMVGRGGLEPPTLRLSGVRSNHLSYRPPRRADREAAKALSQLRLHFPKPVSWLGKRFQDEGT
jgi:hypothetical protein